MIQPAKSYAVSSADFVVTDIENWPDGTVLRIDTAYRNEFGNIEHVDHQTWAEWIDWLEDKARIEERFRRVWAHNGGGWDWLSLIGFLLKERKGRRPRININEVCGKIVTAFLEFKETRRRSEGEKLRKLKIALLDSMQLLRAPLKKLAKTFDVAPKIDLGDELPHETFLRDPKLFREYHQRDTESLLMVMEKTLELIRNHVALIQDFGPTVGSTSLKIFRTCSLERPIECPIDDSIRSFLRRGYSGGRVEVFRPGYWPSLHVYDINSLYPYAMTVTKVPCSARGCWVNSINDERVGCYEIEFQQHDRSIPAIFSIGGNPAYVGRGVYFTPEIRLARDLGLRVCPIRGYEFMDTEFLFAGFVHRLYKLRTDFGEPLSTVVKFILNSLYGKFGQHTERTSLVAVDSMDEVLELMKQGDVREISEELSIYAVPQKVKGSCEHVGIAGMITSAARVILYKGLLQAGKGLVYCDTDSVHTTQRFPDTFLSRNLGDFKLEFSGEGVYTGKKLYALRDSASGETKIRAKGVSVGGRNGHHLTFDDFVAMLAGETITTKFQRPPTALEVLNGENACQFRERKRRLKMLAGAA